MNRVLKLMLGILASVFAFNHIAVNAQSLPNVSIPTALQGYYELEVTQVTPQSPFPATKLDDTSDDIGFYLNQIGEICFKNRNSGQIEVLSSNPQLKYGIFSTVVWQVDALDLVFALDISKNTFDGIDISSKLGTHYARLEGIRQGFDDGSCGSPRANTRDALWVIELAEETSPKYFPASPLSFNQYGNGFDLYRFYPSTGVYLGIKGDAVLARGGDFGVDYIVLGYVSSLISNNTSNLQVPTDAVGSFFHGTYALELTEALPFSPIEESSALTLVLGPTGQMCVGEINLGFPTISYNNAVPTPRAISATWTNVNGNQRYLLDLTRVDDFDANNGIGEFTFQSSSGVTYGLFTGDKTSNSTECGDSAVNGIDTTKIDSFFTLIESEYPQIFPSGPQTYNQKADGFIYRYYFNSQSFVGIKNDTVYVNGGQFGVNANPLPIGTLSALTSQINDAPIGHNFPATSAGTYSMFFSGATVYSPFANARSATVVFDASGNLCLNGSSLGAAVSKNSSPNTAIWENLDLGLKFSVDTASISGSSVSISVASTAGQAYSTLSGSRTSFETACGTSSSALSIAKANQLFGLAEQYYPQYFPSNLLSVNQLSGNTVHRFYQSTGMFVSITGQDVSVRGGPFGGSYVNVGNIDALNTQIVLDNTPTTPTTPTPAAPVYDLRITGSGEVSVLSTTIYPKVDMKDYAVTLPNSNVYSELTSFVRSSFASTLPTIDSVFVYSVTSTSSQLRFNASVSSTTRIGSTETTRYYDLVYTFTKR